MPDEMTALTGISIEIMRGHTVVLKGPSGSGKTTLLGLIGCMSRPTSGSVVVNGLDVSKLPEKFLTSIRRKTFGFIFQQFNLIGGLSVLENVMLPLYPQDVSASEMISRARALLDELGIGGKAAQRVQRLSGGEQQRTAIARALVNDPDIILADEPTAHLDTKLSEEFLSILASLRTGGRTIVIATHDPLVYKKDFIDQTIEISHGKIGREDILRGKISHEDIEHEDIGRGEISHEDIGQEGIGRARISHEDIGSGDIGRVKIGREDINHEDITREDIGRGDTGSGDIARGRVWPP
jgi:putative ABC transport system ATP-binding protein